LKVVYSARYQIDIGPHVFPTQKYSLVHAALLARGVIGPSDSIEPEPASWSDLALVHTAEYLAKLRDGTLSPEDSAQLELPWSAEMVEGFRLMVGGTIHAALLACGGLEVRSTKSEVRKPAHRKVTRAFFRTVQTSSTSTPARSAFAVAMIFDCRCAGTSS
jgi:acetoin utilization deacetylase AcuC-like enzyme